MDALCSGRNRPWKSLCLGRGCSLLRTDQTMNVIMVAPWMLSSQSGLDHGGHYGWARDVLFPERFRLSLDHGRHGWAMDALFSDGVWMRSSESDIKQRKSGETEQVKDKGISHRQTSATPSQNGSSSMNSGQHKHCSIHPRQMQKTPTARETPLQSDRGRQRQTVRESG